MNTLDSILSVSKLAASYGHEPVFNSISFDVHRSEVIAIMGPSGSGKSTLLKVLSGLILPTEGSFQMNLPEGECATLMFQSPLLQPWLTVGDNVALPAKIKQRKIDINSLLSAVGLPSYQFRYPFQLSGGEQRRVALARALSNKPLMLLLDEPFTGVDELTRERLFELLGDVIGSSSISCVLVTHNPYESVYLADRIILLGGSPTTLIREIDVPFAHPRQLSLLDSNKYTRLVNEVRKSILAGGDSNGIS